MRNISVSIVLVVLANGIFVSQSDEVSYAGHQVWSVLPSSQTDIRCLIDIGERFQLDFWKDPVAVNLPVDFLISPEQEQKVKRELKLKCRKNYEVTIPDVQDLINEQMSVINSRKTRSLEELSVRTFDYGQYHDVSEVYEWMDLVQREFNDTVTKRQFGVTYEGRQLYALEFKTNPGTAKPKIFVDALIHCREWVTTASLLFIFKEMLTNSSYSHMMEDADWYFIPMINVDGYHETWTGNRLWRKTVSTGPSAECRGTDANRNWNAFWSTVPGASNNSCSQVYYGPTAESESEVRHLARYILAQNIDENDAYVSVHAAAQMILYPYMYKENEMTPFDSILNDTGRRMSDAVRAVHGQEYPYGRGSTTIYPASGTTSDWTYEVAKIVQSYTYELRDGDGPYSFLLPPDQIIPNGEEFLEGLRVLKEYVTEHFIDGSGISD